MRCPDTQYADLPTLLFLLPFPTSTGSVPSGARQLVYWFEGGLEAVGK